MKKVMFAMFFLVLGSVFCYSQNITGQWEREINKGKFILNFTKDYFELKVIFSDGSSKTSPKIEYFISNGVLIIFDIGGTGIYAAPNKYEYYINGNVLALVPLNAGARFSSLEGKYTRRK